MTTSSNYTLKQLGFNQHFEAQQQTQNLDGFEVGRVALVHKDRYIVKTETADLDAEIIGKLRFTAQSPADFPAVGDWVALTAFDEGKALIHEVLERQTSLERKAVGKTGEVQIVAANIDFAFIVQSVNRDFNLNRIERYLTICYDSGVTPYIVLSKIDLVAAEEIDDIKLQIQTRIPNVQLITLSNVDGTGIEQLKAVIESGKTYCLLGSSGVGKSSLINSIAGDTLMKTGAISEAADRGTHVTTHRELTILNNGGIFIDNPGMREVGMTDASQGLEQTFEQVATFAADCKYADCTHMHEAGCAVLEAIEEGELDASLYDNFVKMQKEQEFFETTSSERKRKEKKLAKIIRSSQKNKKRWKG